MGYWAVIHLKCSTAARNPRCRSVAQAMSGSRGCWAALGDEMNSINARQISGLLEFQANSAPGDLVNKPAENQPVKRV
jgi:hypothetical protein